jgi:ankyrin repeat protein
VKTFQYSYTDGDERKDGTIKAADKSAALKRLSEQGLVITRLEPEGTLPKGRLVPVLRVALWVAAFSLVVGGAWWGLTREVETNSGTRQIMKAIENGDSKQVESLLKSDAALVHERSVDKIFPLQWAVAFEQEEIVNILLKAGADPECRGPNGASPLLWAVDANSVPLTRLFLEKGVDQDSTDQDGNGALHFAAPFDGELTSLLLERKLDPQRANQAGETPLHLAARENSVQVAEMLIQAGADPNTVNKMGQTPLHYAAEEGHLEAVEFLMGKGANPGLKDNQQATPESLASEEGFTEIIKALHP